MKEIMTTAQIIAIADRVIPQWRDTHRIEVNVYARAALMGMKNHNSIIHLTKAYPNPTNKMTMEVRQTLIDVINN